MFSDSNFPYPNLDISGIVPGIFCIQCMCTATGFWFVFLISRGCRTLGLLYYMTFGSKKITSPSCLLQNSLDLLSAIDLLTPTSSPILHVLSTFSIIEFFWHCCYCENYCTGTLIYIAYVDMSLHTIAMCLKRETES